MHVAGGTSIIRIAAAPRSFGSFLSDRFSSAGPGHFLFFVFVVRRSRAWEVAFIELRQSKLLIRSKHLEMVSGAIISQVEVRLALH